MLEAICLHGNIENLENFMSNLGFGLFEESESVLQKRGLLGNLKYVLYLLKYLYFYCNDMLLF